METFLQNMKWEATFSFYLHCTSAQPNINFLFWIRLFLDPRETR